MNKFNRYRYIFTVSLIRRSPRVPRRPPGQGGDLPGVRVGAAAVPRGRAGRRARALPRGGLRDDTETTSPSSFHDPSHQQQRPPPTSFLFSGHTKEQDAPSSEFATFGGISGASSSRPIPGSPSMIDDDIYDKSGLAPSSSPPPHLSHPKSPSSSSPCELSALLFFL